MYSVIVIDDEKSIQNGIKNYIRFMECGFSVTQCFDNGEEALEYLKTNDADVVITDIRMSVSSQSQQNMTKSKRS